MVDDNSFGDPRSGDECERSLWRVALAACKGCVIGLPVAGKPSARDGVDVTMAATALNCPFATVGAVAVHAF